MAIKGAIAKELVAKKIAEAFGEDYLGEQDKKIYIQAYEGGEKVQVAISMTCPKNPIGGMNFEMIQTVDTAMSQQPSVEISENEQSKINELMNMLGI
ncbi:MAG: hypothetical protein E7167_01170 [Firmicutes bacterium]|nr:hypothetical protein [Bacillota bacterium]